jgi:Conserved TM helix
MKNMIIQAAQQAFQNLIHMIGAFLPRFLAMLIIVVFGLVVALVLKYLVRGLLRLTKLDRISETAGAGRFLRMATLPSMTELLSRSIFWVTWFGFLLIGISVLEVAGMQDQISRLFSFLPAVFIAILILFTGLLAANFLSRAVLLASVNADYPSPRALSSAVRFVIWILAISMAFEELGLARETVVAAFSIAFGAVMLGMAIAFGLGGKELARHYLERTFGSAKEKDREPLPM